ncbi:MAG: DUF3501 family protein [Vicinamibacterales bacterium]
MTLLTPADVLGKDAYEEARPDFRRRVMLQKDKRRVLVGEHMTFLFENRDTMLYQVQEMLRAEGSWLRPGAVEEELDAYNALIPATGELSATMMLEYATAAERALMLPQFVRIEQHLRLKIGDAPPLLASFDRGQIDEHKVSSVQYVKWTLSAEHRRLLSQDGTVVRLVVDHPAYTAQAVLSEDTRKAIARDCD